MREVMERMRQALNAFGEGGPALYERSVGAMRAVLADGLHEVFIVGLLVALLAFVVGVFLPELPLRTPAAVVPERPLAPPDLHEVPLGDGERRDDAPRHAAAISQPGGR